jgi:hypothetical protein
MMMMGYVITVREDDLSVRLFISHARCASNAYHWAKAQGHDVTMTKGKVAMLNRSELEASIAQEILSEWVDKGLLLG